MRLYGCRPSAMLSPLSPTLSLVWCKRLNGCMLKDQSTDSAFPRIPPFRTALSPPSTMSNNLTQLVPVLDGTNYCHWAELMKAYLQQQGVWIIVELPAGITEPSPAANGSNQAEVMEWHQYQSKAMGAIRLRLNVEVARQVADKTTAKDLWTKLRDLYGGTSAMGAFSFFKAAINAWIPPHEHPSSAIAKIQGNLDEVHNTGITLSNHLCALIVPGAAPACYSAVVQIVLSNYELRNLTVSAYRRHLCLPGRGRRTRGSLPPRRFLQSSRTRATHPSRSSSRKEGQGERLCRRLHASG